MYYTKKFLSDDSYFSNTEDASVLKVQYIVGNLNSNIQQKTQF